MPTELLRLMVGRSIKSLPERIYLPEVVRCLSSCKSHPAYIFLVYPHRYLTKINSLSKNTDRQNILLKLNHSLSKNNRLKTALPRPFYSPNIRAINR